MVVAVLTAGFSLVGPLIGLAFAAICWALTRKTCPDCQKLTHRSAHVCRGCGYRWE